MGLGDLRNSVVQFIWHLYIYIYFKKDFETAETSDSCERSDWHRVKTYLQFFLVDGRRSGLAIDVWRRWLEHRRDERWRLSSQKKNRKKFFFFKLWTVAFIIAHVLLFHFILLYLHTKPFPPMFSFILLKWCTGASGSAP